MEYTFIIVLLCIDLSLAYHRYPHHYYYSYDDYSEEITPKTPSKTTTSTQRNLVKTKPQYEVTENTVDILDDATVNRRIDMNFMLNKPLNRAVPNSKINVTEKRNNAPNTNELMKNLEEEYKNIVEMLAGNKQKTHERIINVDELLSRVTNMWGKFKRTIQIISEGVDCIVKTRSLVEKF